MNPKPFASLNHFTVPVVRILVLPRVDMFVGSPVMPYPPTVVLTLPTEKRPGISRSPCVFTGRVVAHPCVLQLVRIRVSAPIVNKGSLWILGPRHEPSDQTAVYADGGTDGRRDTFRGRLALRAEVGRVPLPRVPGRQLRKAAVEVGAAAGAVLPRAGRRPVERSGEEVRPRRRDYRSGRRCPVVRRSASENSSGREQDTKAGGRDGCAAHR